MHQVYGLELELEQQNTRHSLNSFGGDGKDKAEGDSFLVNKHKIVLDLGITPLSPHFKITPNIPQIESEKLGMKGRLYCFCVFQNFLQKLHSLLH